MGRGLSELQKEILRMAKAKGPKILLQAEILSQMAGWEPDYDPSKNPGMSLFDRHEIGAERYAGTRASLSRAIRRLEERGLIEQTGRMIRKGSGLRLTEKGRQTAKNI